MIAAPSHSGLAAEIPSEWMASLASRGWTFMGAGDTIIFFERPGYWLRLNKFGDDGWYATVSPEQFRCKTDWEPFAEHEPAPEFRGKGARQRALDNAAAQWREYDSYLAPLAVALRCVGVRQFRSSGGRGSSIGTQTYFRKDLALE